MLSYQHAFHAGNLADVHKHSLLAWILTYLTRKEKPLTYMETHAGRALYDLSDAAAHKTGEAAQGIARAADWFPPDHPYAQVLKDTREDHGKPSYPGSPLIASKLLRPSDNLHLAELHPREHAALEFSLSPYSANCYKRDGFEMAHALIPPTPRRGLLLIDPSYEIKEDYQTIPKHIANWTRAWNVGIIVLWYPVLTNNTHRQMLSALYSAHPQAFRHEVTFPPARPGHGMVGSGLFVINPPYGLSTQAQWLSQKFSAL